MVCLQCSISPLGIAEIYEACNKPLWEYPESLSDLEC